MSEENVEIVRKLIVAFQEGLERGDPGAAYDMGTLAADAEWVTPDLMGGESFIGREGFIEFMRRWTEDFDDWVVQIEQLIDAGDDRVVGLFHQRATGRNSGVPVELEQAVVYDLDRGRVVRMRNYTDRTKALEAAGLSD